jgi:uncharacterized membrane protein YdjX (TVP38/TMEM64 family)
VQRPWYDLGVAFTPRGAVVLLAVLAVAVVASVGLEWAVSQVIEIAPADVQEGIDGFGLLAPVVYIAVYTATIVFTPLPSVPVDVAGGLAFGVMVGTGYVMTGAMIGASIDFYLARWLGRGFLERKLSPQVLAQVDGIATRMGGRVLFLSRLFPLFNFKWVSYAAGLTRITYRTYAVATFLGTLIPAIAIVYVGDVLLTHPGRSALVFSGLVVWAALPPVVFLVWALTVRLRALLPLSRQ